MTNDRRNVTLVVDADQRFADEVAPLLGDREILVAVDAADARSVVSEGKVDLVLLGPSFATDAALASVGSIIEARPSLEVVLVADIVTNRLLKAALRAGLSDVIDAPVSESDLAGHADAVPAPDAPLTEVEVVIEPSPPPTETTFDAEPALPRSSEEQDEIRFDAPEQQRVDPSAVEAGDEEWLDLPPAWPDTDFTEWLDPGDEGPAEPRTREALQSLLDAVDGSPATGAPSSDPAVHPAEPGSPLVIGDPDPFAQPPSAAGDVLDQVMPPPPVMPPPGPPERTASGPPAGPGASRVAGGRVIAVMAGKGGSGKTITAANLAIAVGLRSDPERVAIVDADLQFGDVALMLQIDPVRTLDDVVGRIEQVSDEQLEAALLTHSSGIRVLAAPRLPVRAGEIESKSIVALLERLRSLYDTVIVDTGPVFDEELVTLLEHADEIVAVVDMDLPSVKNAKVALDGLRRQGFDMSRIRLVVNRVNSKARLDVVEIEHSLGLRIGGSIPSDRLVPQSVNEGSPVVITSPRSKVARAFHALAEAIEPESDWVRLTDR